MYMFPQEVKLLSTFALKVGFIEHLLIHPQPVATIEKYLVKCRDMGFDVIELSKGFLSLPGEDSSGGNGSKT